VYKLIGYGKGDDESREYESHVYDGIKKFNKIKYWLE
jgi:hypothetical protein